MITDINEPIRVKMIMGRGTIRIISLFWNNSTILVDSITYRWITKNGIYPLFHFAVSCGKNIMEIHFDPIRLQWKLDRIHMEG